MEQKGQRVEALDAMRGFDMMFITGLGGVVAALHKMFAAPWTQWLTEQFEHVHMAGLHVEDLIFPTFIFIAGASFPFSCHKSLETGRPVFRKALIRCLLLIFLGFLYNGLLIDGPAHCRYASVLARIGTAWFGGAMMYLYIRKRAVRWSVAAAILVAYWLFMVYVPVPGAPAGASFTEQYNWGSWLDRRFLPGYSPDWAWHADPEGLVSLLPSIVLGLFGAECGDLLYRCRQGEFSQKSLLVKLVCFGAALVAAALVWRIDFPIMKKLWSSSFICMAGGIAALVLALFYLLADVLKLHKTLFVFKVIGMNALTIYMAQRVIGFEQARGFFFKWAASLFPGAGQALCLAVGYMAVEWAFLYFLYRRGIFIRL
jgi:predicted acyltransferase